MKKYVGINFSGILNGSLGIFTENIDKIDDDIRHLLDHHQFGHFVETVQFNNAENLSESPLIQYLVFIKFYQGIDGKVLVNNFNDRFFDFIRRSDVKLVFNSGMESESYYHYDTQIISDYTQLRVLEGSLREKNIPLDKVYFFSSQSESVVELFKINNVFGDFANVATFPFLLSDTVNFFKSEVDKDKITTYLSEMDLHSTDRSWHFLCLNGTIKDHRIALVMRLFFDKILYDKSFVSFLMRNVWVSHINSQNRVQAAKDDIKQLKHSFGNIYRTYFGVELSDVELDSFINELPLHLDSNESDYFEKNACHGSWQLELPVSYFNHSYLSLITESHFYSGNQLSVIPSRFLTEKTFHRLIVGHPFIILGDYKINEAVRELGFEPYDEYYSHFDGLYDRIGPFCNYLTKFSDMIDTDYGEFKKIYAGSLEKARYNQSLILSDNFVMDIFIRGIERLFGEKYKVDFVL